MTNQPNQNENHSAICRKHAGSTDPSLDCICQEPQPDAVQVNSVQADEVKLIVCDICEISIHPAESFVGNGDGFGKRFAHRDCYFRKELDVSQKRTADLEKALENDCFAHAEKIAELESTISTGQKLFTKTMEDYEAKIDEMELEKDVAVAGLHAFTKQAEGQLEESRLQIQAQKKVIEKFVSLAKCFRACRRYRDSDGICCGCSDRYFSALQSAAALEKK